VQQENYRPRQNKYVPIHRLRSALPEFQMWKRKRNHPKQGVQHEQVRVEQEADGAPERERRRRRFIPCGTLGGFRTSREGLRQAKPGFAHAHDSLG
jgi:hypothetical protein